MPKLWYTSPLGEYCSDFFKSCTSMTSIDFLVNPFVLPVMEGVPSVVRPHNLAGFCSSFSITLIACSHISCPVVVEERLAMYNDSSTTSKPTVAAMLNMSSWAVSLMSVLSSKARRKAAHDCNLF